MPDAAQPVLRDPNAEHCPRCLQVLPPKASRCPDCGQPIHFHSLRLLPFAVGIAGLLALVFVMFVMYRMAKNEEAARAPVPVDDNASQQELFHDSPPANGKANEPSKPDKRPPLDER
jgi:hypothetical protein